MAFEGMDVAEVQSLAGQLHNQAESIGQVVAAIDSLIGQLEGVWRGADATEFAGWWQQQHKPHLLNAQAAIDGLHQSALNNAQAQIDASQA